MFAVRTVVKPRLALHIVAHGKMSENWEELSGYWQRLCQWTRLQNYGQLRAMTLMQTHLHFLLEPRRAFTAKEMGNEFCEEFDLEKEFFRAQEIDSHRYYCQAYKYIYRNPVSAGICPVVEDYSFSTLSELLGKIGFQSGVVDNMNLVQNTARILTWLNDPSIEMPYYSMKSFHDAEPSAILSVFAKGSVNGRIPTPNYFRKR